MSDTPVNVLIAFYSRNGSTEALAGAVAEGARTEGANVVLRRARELVTMYNVMAHLGLIIVPLGYADPAMFRGAGSPYGASSVSGQESNPPTEDDLEVARFQGRRVAQVARALKAAKSA